MAFLKELFGERVDLGAAGHADSLLQAVEEDANLVEKEVAVHRGGKTFTERRMVRAEEHPDASASMLSKAKDVAVTAMAKAYRFAKLAINSKSAGVIAAVLAEVLDTPKDMEKLGYNPSVSSGGSSSAATHDAVKAQLGVSGHLVAAIASRVLVKAAYWIKQKLRGGAAEAAEAAETAEDELSAWAEFIADLLKHVAEGVGHTGELPTAAAIRTALSALLKGKL